MLKFYDADDVKGSVSIYESHITFNKSMLNYLKDAYRVRIGIDSEDSKVYIFMYDKDQSLSGEFKETSLLKLSISKTYARISSRSVVNYFLESFNLTLPESGFLKFEAVYDELKKAIVFNVGGAE